MNTQLHISGCSPASGTAPLAQPSAALKSLTQRWSPPLLLQAIAECIVDGILILTEQAELIYANTHAWEICQRLVPNFSSVKTPPLDIWHLCEALIESRELFPDQLIALEDEIGDRKCPTVRIRAQWIELSNPTMQPCLLVILEDRRQSCRNLAITESQKYGLTPRQAEVWIRHQEKFTYKQIAEDLHITINTVKKHVKNINMKRDAACLLEC